MTDSPTKKTSHLVQLRRTAVLTRIASGEPVSKIARELGLSEWSIYKSLQHREGLKLVHAAIDDAHGIIRHRLPDLVTKALDILESQLSASDPDRRARAARTVLSVAAKFAEASSQTFVLDQGAGQVIDSTTITRAKEGPHNDL